MIAVKSSDEELDRDSDLLLLVDLLTPNDARLPTEVAQWLLSAKFSDAQRARMLDLADRGNQGVLTTAEREEMMGLVRVGDLLSILHSKARMALRQSTRSE